MKRLYPPSTYKGSNIAIPNKIQNPLPLVPIYKTSPPPRSNGKQFPTQRLAASSPSPELITNP